MITLALTHFNRYTMLRECIAKVEDDPRISEIVVSDDASTDGSYEKLQEYAKLQLKLQLYRNPLNLDCHQNKQRAVLRARNPWVILFDSDNVLTPDYLDVVCGLKPWISSVVYCPEFAEPHFDYRRFSGVIVDQHTVASYARDELFRTALNTCNYFVSRVQYLRTWDGSVNPHTADSIFQAFCWLKGGNQIHIVPRLRYFHRVHDGSHYKQNVHKTGGFARKVEDQLKAMK